MGSFLDKNNPSLSLDYADKEGVIPLVFMDLVAINSQGTFAAFGIPGSADLSAKKHHAMTQIAATLSGENIADYALYFLGILFLFGIHTEPAHDPYKMRIADDRWPAVKISNKKISNFPAYSGQSAKGIYIIWYHARKLVYKHP